MNPGTVVIDAGQTVTFRVYPGHRVAIYKPGVRPEDVVLHDHVLQGIGVVWIVVISLAVFFR